MFNNQIIAGSSGQGGEVQQSLKFNDDESQYLSWTPAAAGNRKTWTWSAWLKRTPYGTTGTLQDPFSAGTGSTNRFELFFSASDAFIFYMNTGGTIAQVNTSVKYRDPSGWYHFVVAVDTTQATASDRVKIYVNGEQVTALDTTTYPTLNRDTPVSNTTPHYIGKFPYNSSRFYDGYISDVNFIDGQALDPTSFGQFTNGYWKKKDYAGSYGTNGFHLTFADDVVSEGFNAVTYTGNGGTQSISGLGFEPDFLWFKK